MSQVRQITSWLLGWFCGRSLSGLQLMPESNVTENIPSIRSPIRKCWLRRLVSASSSFKRSYLFQEKVVNLGLLRDWFSVMSIIVSFKIQAIVQSNIIPFHSTLHHRLYLQA
ncbi:hypothetical protein J3R30DRAFT_3428401 [Lentinula aciculospora]|uniref:Secreted protein n=1 Tax=Lentinula aciculospora TaxID=153920 RepID=A0A9W9AVT8_9AGAR|nr:hypothetical protein J3R30DRAFT_3428401 [Lentinula aciculospora]